MGPYDVYVVWAMAGVAVVAVIACGVTLCLDLRHPARSNKCGRR